MTLRTGRALVRHGRCGDPGAPCGISSHRPRGALSWSGQEEKNEDWWMMAARKRTRPRILRQEPGSVTWAREKCGLTKRQLAQAIGISEQLMGEIESGWRSATPINLI